MKRAKGIDLFEIFFVFSNHIQAVFLSIKYPHAPLENAIIELGSVGNFFFPGLDF